MLEYLLLSVLYFLIIFTTGFSLILKISPGKIKNIEFMSIYLLGFITLSIVNSYFSLFFPINRNLTLGFALTSIFFILLYKRKFIDYISRLRLLSLIDVISIFFIILINLFFSSSGIYNYDSGLYHVQAIKWIQNFPVIPGLGNFHGRFAFNSMYFPISAAFSLNNANTLIFPLTTITFIVFLIWQYFNLKKYILKRDIKGVGLTFSIVLPLFGYFSNWISSPSADVICSIFSVIILQFIVNNTKGKIYNLILISLVFLLTSYKLSMVPLTLITLFYIHSNTLFKDIIKISGLAIFILLPFFIRNYYLSGYLIYPFPDIDLFSPDWKIPLSEVVKEKSWIKSWAIKPHVHFNKVLVQPTIEWFSDWFLRQRTILKLVLLVSFTTPFIAFKIMVNGKFMQLKIVSILIVCISFWLYNAPDPRFILGILVFTSSYTLFLTIDLKNRVIKNLSLIYLIVIIPTLSMKPILSMSLKTYNSFQEDKNLFVRSAAFDNNPLAFNKEFKNFEYFTPINGDRCFNCDIPCTPYPKNDLIMRGQNFIKGFKIKEK